MAQRARRKKAPQVAVASKQEERKIIPLSEAKKGAARAYSLAWDDNEAMGMGSDMRRSGPGLLSDQERKETLYKAYLNSVWISSCVDVISKRITSGGYLIDDIADGKGAQSEHDQIDQLLHYVNDDEDFLQLVRAIATDLLIYGECYMEIVLKGSKPYQLHKIDCQTMSYQLDRHGAIVKYVQTLNHSQDTIEFGPDEVVRWWFPDPQSSKKALSPIERILGPVDADTRMADWVRKFFRQGARPSYWIKTKGNQDEGQRLIKYFRENYTGAANAHVPMILYEDAELHEIGKGSIDVDFLKGREQMCKEILAAYHVPPALVGLIESGNIGGGTGESQEKSFQFNACDPLRQLIFEKFNYRIINKAFGITDWMVNTRYADYRSDDVIAKLQDMRIRNGSNTVNEVRNEIGKAPVEGGDEAVITTGRDILPVQRLADLADEQRQQMTAQIEQQQAQAEISKVQADQAKNTPEQTQQNVDQHANDDEGDQEKPDDGDEEE